MINFNFATEFSRRADLLYQDEAKFEAMFSEYQSLDPREANIIYQSFEYKPGTPEHAHAKTRLSALVAAGTISSDLAYLANSENIPSEDNIPESYYDSRNRLWSALESYNEYGKNILDPDGKLEHMISRGDTKSRLISHLSRSTFYKAQQDLVDNKSDFEDTDIAPRVAILKFEAFLEALDKVEDLPTPPDFAEIAKVAIKEYDTTGAIAKLIDEGASSLEVLQALDSNPAWVEDALDYMTRNDVEFPRAEQKKSWSRFLGTLNSIKDIDDQY